MRNISLLAPFKTVVLRYTMIKHHTDTGNKINPNRDKLLEIFHRFQKTDGLSNLK